jgi:hypothetical protein
MGYEFTVADVLSATGGRRENYFDPMREYFAGRDA